LKNAARSRRHSRFEVSGNGRAHARFRDRHRPPPPRRLSALRADATIGDDAFHRVEEELDRAELSAEAMDPED
jgi:hypothetical protein